tara:strand:+ start:74 stop:508 length:435 start_codon:yes stop_codon:yes gene_type:complete
VTDLLDTTGKSFIISGFIFFVLSIPLYYSYTPLYTGAEDFATNLLFFATLGFCWTFIGTYPIILSMAIKNIEVGDLVFYRDDIYSSGPGLVLEKVKDAPTGLMDEEDEWVTAPKYKVAWQDQQSVDWYWEDSISHYEKVSRGEQ